MSILSPVAAAILNSLQAGAQNESAADAEAFQSLLDANSGAQDAAATATTKNALDLASIDLPAQLPTVVFTESKAPALPQERVENNETPLPANDGADARQSGNAPQREAKSVANDNNNTNVKDAPRQQAPAPAPANSSKQVADTKSAAPADKPQAAAQSENADSAASEDDAIMQKLRTKIDELSDILASLAAMLNVGNVSQVTVVQIKQTTLTLSQQSLGVNQPFLDVSDRFDKLIAAVTASQVLPSDAGTSLGATFASFQRLLATLTGDNTALNSTTLQANCAACETDLSASLQNLQLAKGDTIDIGQLSDQLQKLSKWLGDVQNLFTPASPAVAAASPEVTPEVLQAVLPAATQASAMQTAVVATTTAAISQPVVAPKIAAPKEKVVEASSAVASVLAASAPEPSQVVQPQVQNVATTNVAVTSAATENSANTGGNFSGGANNNSGQQSGGERPAAMSTFSGVGTAANNAGAVGASSFSKVLKAATTAQPAPVAEQVAFNIKTAVKDGASKIQIQLDPESLGKLHIKIDVGSDGKATGVVITADHKSTLDLLQRDARGLEAALSDAGIKTDAGSLSFNLRGGDSGQGRDEAPKAPYATYTNAVEEEDAMAPLSVVSKSYVVNVADGLDIQI